MQQKYFPLGIRKHCVRILLPGVISFFIIKNNGEKIPLEIQEKIFNDGFTTKENGSGLGLMLTKSMLSEQNLTLTLCSSSDDVTIFNISTR